MQNFLVHAQETEMISMICKHQLQYEKLTGGEHLEHALSYSNHMQAEPTLSTRIRYSAFIKCKINKRYASKGRIHVSREKTMKLNEAFYLVCKVCN